VNNQAFQSLSVILGFSREEFFIFGEGICVHFVFFLCVGSGAFCPRFAHPCRGEKEKQAKKKRKKVK